MSSVQRTCAAVRSRRIVDRAAESARRRRQGTHVDRPKNSVFSGEEKEIVTIPFLFCCRIFADSRTYCSRFCRTPRVTKRALICLNCCCALISTNTSAWLADSWEGERSVFQDWKGKDLLHFTASCPSRTAKHPVFCTQ